MSLELSNPLVERLLKDREATRFAIRLRVAVAALWHWWGRATRRPVSVAPVSETWLREHERTAARHPDAG